MGGMLLNKFLELNLVEESDVYIANRSRGKIDAALEKFPSLNVCESNVELAKKCKNIFLCVEPLNMPGVLMEIRDYLSDDTYLMVSTTIVSSNDIYKIHKGKITIFMPTLISMVNGGVTLAYHNDSVEAKDRDLFEGLLNNLGEVSILGEEDIKLTQNITACFPGFFAEIMSEIVKSASKRSSSVEDKELEHLLLVSVLGAARLLLEKNMGFDETINRVATKGGITYEGVSVLKDNLPMVFDKVFDATLSKYDVVTEKASNMIDELVK
jgi:pyrroline-5-carboxylate reductase